MTGIFVIPMMTASGPPSEEDGVLLPFEMWWRGLAESSSLLITEEGPRVRNKDFLVTQYVVPFPQKIPFFFRTNLSSIRRVNSSLCVPCWPYLRNFVCLGSDGEQWVFSIRSWNVKQTFVLVDHLEYIRVLHSLSLGKISKFVELLSFSEISYEIHMLTFLPYALLGSHSNNCQKSAEYLPSLWGDIITRQKTQRRWAHPDVGRW